VYYGVVAEVGSGARLSVQTSMLGLGKCSPGASTCRMVPVFEIDADEGIAAMKS